tara:strand:- start:10314 stop:10973 length:660 start_codon:yes stop_codon:yes gene_type:complete
LNTTNWTHYYSVDNHGTPWPTGAIYEPLVSPDGNTLCLRFDATNKFRNDPVSEELATECFRREVFFLKKFQAFDWCAKLLHIDNDKQEVFIEWNTECCEKIIESGRSLYDYAPNWKAQLKQITTDIRNEEVYKITMYPCYHFVKEQQVKVFGFYTTCNYQEQPIDITIFRPILNEERANFIDSVWPDGKVDFALLNKHSFLEYVKWPEDPLPQIYKEVY